MDLLSLRVNGSSAGGSDAYGAPELFDRAQTLLLAQEVVDYNVAVMVGAVAIAFGVLEAVAGAAWRRALGADAPEDTCIKLTSLVGSSVHAVLSVPCVLLLWSSIVAFDEGPGGLLGLGPLAHVPMSLVNVAGSLFGGYLVWDLVHTIRNRATYEKDFVSFMMHHAGYIAMLMLNKDTLWVNWAFPVLYCGEWSTIFLNARGACRLLNRPDLVWSALFALSFFLTRVVVLGLLVAHLFSQAAVLYQLLSAPLLVSYLGLVPAMYALNLFWFSKIAMSVHAVLSGGSKAKLR